MTASLHCCGTFPSRQMRVVSRWNCSRMARSCCSPSFSSSAGSPSGPTAFSFAIAFIAVAISSSVGSIPRALAIGCCGSLFGMSGSSTSDLEFSNERKNRTHLSRTHPLLRSSLPPSSRTHCDSTFFISSSCIDMMFWKNPCWSPIRNCFSNSTTWRSKKRTTAALRTLLSQLHAFLTALQLCISGVCFQALPRCVHRISRSLQLSFRLGVSSPTSSWPPSFLGWDHQLSGPHDGCGECGFYVIHIAVSRRVCPEVPSNCCGHLLSKLGIRHQAPTVHWRLS